MTPFALFFLAKKIKKTLKKTPQNADFLMLERRSWLESYILKTPKLQEIRGSPGNC